MSVPQTEAPVRPAPQKSPPDRGATAIAYKPPFTASKAFLVGVVVAALGASAVVRSWQVKRLQGDAVAKTASASSGASLQQADGYTLGLLLGGLRGPLVMALWSSSENQKTEKNLEDIDTKIELIRLLQPEFDTVHLFQIWNKAYNLSVQMANLPSKYSTILDALDYAWNVKRERPENLNIEATIAGVLFDKLGNSAEKAYYQARVREDTLPPSELLRITIPASTRGAFVAAATAVGAEESRYSFRPEPGSAGARLTTDLRAERGEAVLAELARRGITVDRDKDVRRFPPTARSTGSGGRRTAYDSLLVADANGDFRLKRDPLGAVVASDFAGKADDTQWRPQDGEYAYLVRYEPYPYGVSPFALGFNYYKRSVALQVSRQQVHAQMSDRVISSRVGIALRYWADEEDERARRAEAQQFGIRTAEFGEVEPRNVAAAALPISSVARTPLIDQAIYSYDRASQLYAESTKEFDEHVKRMPEDQLQYRSFTTWQDAAAELAKADADYLRAMIVPAGDVAARNALLASAKAHYQRGEELTLRHAFAFWTKDEDVGKPGLFPAGVGKDRIFTAPISLDELRGTYSNYMQQSQTNPAYYSTSELNEYASYAQRAAIRTAQIDAALGAPATAGR